MNCKGSDPNCSAGWISVIQVMERTARGLKVVEERPYGPDVVGDPKGEKYAQAWHVFDGQMAYEAVKPCRFCKPNWTHPDDRMDDHEAQKEAEGRIEAKRRGDFWDDDPPALGVGS